MSDFFEGKDFKNGIFKALTPSYYPPQYQEYIRQESELLAQRMRGAHRILEAGVGIGRLIPILAPLVDEIVGIDNADLMLQKSQEMIAQHFNVKIVKGNMEELCSLFSEGYFDYSLCVWNTLGNVSDETIVLQQLRQVTQKSIFITVYKKGTLHERMAWYAAVDIPLLKIDEKNEIFYTKSGLISKSYHEEEIRQFAANAKSAVVDCRTLSDVMLWIELAPYRYVG